MYCSGITWGNLLTTEAQFCTVGRRHKEKSFIKIHSGQTPPQLSAWGDCCRSNTDILFSNLKFSEVTVLHTTTTEGHYCEMCDETSISVRQRIWMFKCYHILLIRCLLKSDNIFSLMHCAPFQKTKQNKKTQKKKHEKHVFVCLGSTDPRLSFVSLAYSTEEID